LISYQSGQDGAILPARDTGYVPQGTFVMLWCFIPYNKSFIDQACSVKMAGYWPRSSFVRDEVEVHKHAKKELGQYPAILTTRLANNPYIINPLTVDWLGARLGANRQKHWVGCAARFPKPLPYL